MDGTYPVAYDVDYPERKLSRLTSAFRLFTAIPIVIVLTAIGGVTEVTTPRATRRPWRRPGRDCCSCRRC